ncbi:hypothetical protein DEAC_c19090 [Desulfosporosinus acididurans]|uniref:Spore protein YkvP/CgeB glycosyl transferase-like domain-containing protein n=1 Tax=Desulfosporosinus acididurans TaxID=476652 RepID=A0A0J1FSA6_9FIRM|nr:glycosyltransferase [Desulfosporosinus acididurans]KLU65873.1 hypothetical protein DEAC_c19090 [Desulfosporosinus acididurans]
MGRIVLLKGQSQYDVLRIFIDQLGAAFSQQLGKEVYIVDLLSPNMNDELNKAFSQPCEFAVAFNAMGGAINLDNQNMYDVLDIPFVAVLVDHPLYHEERLGLVKNMIVTCVDRDHVNYLKQVKHQATKAFLPHGGSKWIGDNDSDESNRKINVLFGGSYLNSNHAYEPIKDLPNYIKRILDEVIEATLWQNGISMEDSLNKLIENRDIYVDDELSYKLNLLLRPVDQFIRARRREKVIEVLAKSGIEVDIYGNGWEDIYRASSLRIHQPVDFLSMLKLMNKSKIVLNIGPNFANGSHERVFSAMLNGAMAVADNNQYFASAFESEEEILLFDWRDLDILPDKIADYLSKPDQISAIANKGRKKAETKHTWRNRAEKIIEIVEVYTMKKKISMS